MSSLQVKPVTFVTGWYLLKQRSGDTGVFLNLTRRVKVRRVPKSSNLYKALALSAGLKNFHASVKMNLLILYGELFKVITDR